MKKYLLPKQGKFYKANMHCHSTISDGNWDLLKIKEEYKKHGYSIVAFTDHDVFIPHKELRDENFLPLHGFEIEINSETGKHFDVSPTCHLCMIAKDENIINQPCYYRGDDKYYFANSIKNKVHVKYDESIEDFIRVYGPEGINKLIKTCKDSGFFVTYNHPNWSLENFELFTKLDGLDAIEMFNSTCIVEGHLDINEKEYDAMIRSGRYVYCVGGDDNHNFHPESSGHFDSFKSFTMIKAKSLTYKDVISGLTKGHIYASQGPLIKSLYVEDGYVHIKCSPSKIIRYNTGSRRAEIIYSDDLNKKSITEASFKIKEGDVYFRITIIDKNHKQANTIAYFTKNFKLN